MTIEKSAAAAHPGTITGRAWRRFAVATGLTFGLGAAWLVWRMPLQVSDSLLLMLDSLSAQSGWVFGWQHSDSGAFFRPLYLAQVKWLMDLSPADHTLSFKVLHVGLLLATAWLFVRMLNVRTREDFLALPLACTVLLGSHTFLGLARESFPVNHYLEIVLGCLIVANLALSERPNWWRDAAAATAVLLSLATLESGALVWVCLAAGMLSGAAGVSKRGFALATAVVLGYIAIRVFVVGMPLPGLAERSTGFGFARLEPADLTTRFGDRPLVLYTYNIVSSILTVLWSEPRAGEWMFLRAFLSGDVRPWMWINVVSSLLLCGATVAWWFHPRARVGIRNSHEAYVRVAFPAVLVANAVISYSYTKDVLMAPAGVFAAAAAYYATRALFDRSRAALVPIVPLGIAVLLAVLSIGWAARAAGFYYNMREAAFLRANEWALVDQWLSKERIVLQDGASLALVDELRSRALADEVPNPYFAQRWASRYVDRGQR